MEQKKVSPNRAKKEQIVAKLADKVSRAKGLVFTNYQGLTHVQLEKLKKALREANAELIVTKNTLLKLSLLNSKLEAKYHTVPGEARNSKQYQNSNAQNVSPSPVPSPLEGEGWGEGGVSDFQGPTATLFLYADTIEPLKHLAHAIKELKLPTVKFGIIEGKALTSNEVLKLATLPSRDILIAQLLFQMKAPIYRLHKALGWNIQKLVMTLKAIETKKH